MSASLPTLELPDVKRSITSRASGASFRTVENSGICETTPGVHTVSGYIDVGNNENYFFWFFSSRQTTNASKAPLVLWFHGGPGCSSMVGLFQGRPDSSSPFFTLPYEAILRQKTALVDWNEVANVMYIDQPIGAGFSHGTQNADDSTEAASKIWVMLQAFFGKYPRYQGRELILALEGYGGHYGPEFVNYFDAQNKLIRLGKLKGEVITVSALMISGGWIDPIAQYASYPEYAVGPPGYSPIISNAVFNHVSSSLLKNGGCLDLLKECNSASGTDTSCFNAYLFCTQFVFGAASGGRDPYDITSTIPDPLPSFGYINYLQQPKIQKAIGAEVKYSECNANVFDSFVKSGDFTRTLLPQLGALADSKLKMLVWYGDADYICNWVGGLEFTRKMEWYGKDRFGKASFKAVKISGVGDVGQVINVDNFSFLLVFNAGHEVPFYQPMASLEFLKQVVAKQQIHSI
ncbi:hypothetical protein FRB96_001398 [Tulasnella sp. 330]|nr:hypothetical protein FRB96_001398 [Tulasnella sp. 330]KAG8879952.1 hypothetical protein FRB98_005441 [Tulasnella sp. 332]